MYNYNLETGTVGTNDENIANILYNINRMEMDKDFSSSDIKELDETLGDLYFMIADSKVHLNRFLEIFNKNVNAGTVNTVVSALDEAMKSVREVRLKIRAKEDSNAEDMCVVFSEVYKNLLHIVPDILALDNQAVGRV